MSIVESIEPLHDVLSVQCCELLRTLLVVGVVTGLMTGMYDLRLNSLGLNLVCGHCLVFLERTFNCQTMSDV